MERHINRSVATEADEEDDRMPDLESIVPLLSPPLVFRNGKITSRRTEDRRIERERRANLIQSKRAARS
jgi:hypothetical protein